MAFTVETGSGAADSNSYVSVASADTYFSDRSNTTWSAASTASKQAALVKATSYIDSMVSFIGFKTSGTQALKWPRYEAEDEDGYAIASTTIPQKLKDCTCEFAVLVVGGTDLITTPTKSVVKEKIDGAVEIVYDTHSPDGTRYTDIWALISGLTGGSSAIMGYNVRS